MKRIILVLMLCGITLFGGEFMDKKLQELMEKYNLVGMSVAIVENTKMIYSGYFGKQDIRRDIDVNSQTKYRIASISKMVTSIAILQLYDKGLFKLDDDVSNYFGFEVRNPFFPNQIITFQHLLSHQSGIRDGDHYFDFLFGSYKNEEVSPIQYLLAKDGKLTGETIWSKDHGPDEGYFVYCNLNFGILGTLVEILSGERFDLYCRKHIFDQMEIDCSFNVSTLEDIDNLAVIYRMKDGEWKAQIDDCKGVKPKPRELKYKPGTNGIIYAPQGGLRASADDLSKILIMQMNNGIFKDKQILKPETTKLLQTPVWEYNGKNGETLGGVFKDYCLGNHTTIDLLLGEKLIGHGGEAYGLISDFYHYKDRKYGIVFLTNGGEWSKGKHSGWFDVEEEVFEICNKWLETK